jgi:hypothetical protein
MDSKNGGETEVLIEAVDLEADPNKISLQSRTLKSLEDLAEGIGKHASSVAAGIVGGIDRSGVSPTKVSINLQLGVTIDGNLFVVNGEGSASIAVSFEYDLK